MQFDLTNINLLDFTRALIAFSESNIIALLEKEIRSAKDELTESITEADFKNLIQEFNNTNDGIFPILDYYKGSPIKLTLRKKSNGQILFSSLGYDTRVDKYKVLEILLELFDHRDIKIIQKTYGEFESHFEKDSLKDERVIELKKILKHTIKKKDQYGIYYSIEENSYRSKILGNLDINQ
ncbi:hypothetical protein [Empedobacter brevis]|uniref:hypothetical protein n=1 Tax=Empedobacter brevis TaxID=247 RepID=UPI0028AB47B0|nr:hypothetical protein [Empedobacter brevis]